MAREPLDGPDSTSSNEAEQISHPETAFCGKVMPGMWGWEPTSLTNAFLRETTRVSRFYIPRYGLFGSIGSLKLER